MSFFIEHLEYAPVLFAISLVFIGILIESLFSAVSDRKLYQTQDTLSSLAMYAGYVAIDFIWIPILFSIYAWLHRYSFFKLGDAAWQWGILFLLDDFCFYIFHRTSHKIRFLWAAHVPHHSSTYFNLSVGLRQSWTPFVTALFWCPLALVGFNPLMILLMQLISLTIQAFLHTQAVSSLGPLEWILNSPSHHRVHHGTQRQYRDKNFGGVLIIWDRFFGTFEPEKETPRFGIGLPTPRYNPLSVEFSEWGLMLKEVIARGPRMLIEYDRSSHD